MVIRIKVKTQPNAATVETSAASGTSVEALLSDFEKALPYIVTAARVDGRIRALDTVIEKPCTVEFLDIRDNAADRVYQRTLTFVYLKAVRDVTGARTTIFNSLSRGLYTEINADEPVTDEQIAEIRARMQHYIDSDTPISRASVGREELLKFLEREGMGTPERLALFRYATDVHHVAVYNIGDYRNFFLGFLLPSAGRLKIFDITRYKNGVLLRYPHPTDPSCLPPMLDDFKLYDAFKEGWKTAQILGLRFVGDLNEEIKKGAEREIISLSERLHSVQVEQIADRIREKKKRVILLAGPSSSGKTTTAKHIAARLGELGERPLYLGTDDYFVEREQTPIDENGELNFESIDAIDVALFDRNIADLLAGKEVDLPTFDFLTGHKVYGKRVTSLVPGQPILIEGLHALNPAMTAGLPMEEKYRIYISPLTQLNLDDHNRIPTTDVRLLRRMIRDKRTRGHSVANTIRDWDKVRRSENIHVFPYAGKADAIFNSALLYELPVLRSHAEALLHEITPDMPEYDTAMNLYDFLLFFARVENEAAVPHDSILREFIGEA
jgi:uridine kinase